MPLPASAPRNERHIRRIDLRGYEREDGLFDIEAHLIDTKTYPFRRVGHTVDAPAGTPLHEMWIRLVIDTSFTVVDVVAVTDAAPHAICPQAAASLQRIKGMRLTAGWTRGVNEALRGTEGCTHLRELLLPMATAAFQTLHTVRQKQGPAPGRPAHLDTCYGYAAHREVVKRVWPDYYRPETPPPSA